MNSRKVGIASMLANLHLPQEMQPPSMMVMMTPKLNKHNTNKNTKIHHDEAPPKIYCTFIIQRKKIMSTKI